ncbi:MAG: O-antigen ligase family protein, partial [Actinomycetota bacterium]
MRTAGERTVPAAGAAAAAFAALFFAGGELALGPLVWIGAIALVPAALALWQAPAQGRRAAVFLGCLWGLAVWCGLTILWSASPDTSWGYTNQTLAYAAFATLGILIGPQLDRVAAAATVLVAAVVGWALLTKCIPSLYSPPDGVARLRAPVDEWNMLALVCVAGVPLALWLAQRLRVAGAILLYASVVALLLTYSRFGVALAILAGVAWVLREDEKVERIADGIVATAAGAVVALVAASLDGITADRQPHGVRVHDGWVFLLVLLAGGVAVSLVTVALGRLRLTVQRRRALERAAAVLALLLVVAGLVVAGVESKTLWDSFTKPVAAQTTNTSGHLTQLGSGNRWQWWKEAWHGFTDHPLGGTGAGTFAFTDLRYRQSTDISAEEPHNTPLQFLSETGIVGFLLFLGAVAAALA